MIDLLRQSPLPRGSRDYRAAAFDLRELEAVAKVRVQVLRSRGLSVPAVSSMSLPGAPNTASGVDPVALWKAPDDWLVYSQTLTAGALSDWVAAVTSESPLVVTDVSSASAVFELRGPRAIDVLLRDCSLDLEGDAIRPDACAQTLFAQTSVLIHRPAEPHTWRLFVERSVALHVWEWLVDTAGPAREASR
ncbi:MAG: sarcosine oxidase subunit gamma family protein [Gammaproteobacteria bacterium]